MTLPLRLPPLALSRPDVLPNHRGHGDYSMGSSILSAASLKENPASEAISSMANVLEQVNCHYPKLLCV